MSTNALFNAVPAGAIEILYDEQNQPGLNKFMLEI